MFATANWEGLTRQGYTVVAGAIDPALLRAAQGAAQRLNEIYPDGGWELPPKELWREVRVCRNSDFLAIASTALDSLAVEILESAPPIDFVQLASTLPGFTTKKGIGRHFHIDGGREHGVFNLLFGVALTDVLSEMVGGFHVLPGSQEAFARAFKRRYWGNVRRETLSQLLPTARFVVPRLAAGDIVVAHAFLAHGTSANLSGVRRDMIFQRRIAAPLGDPSTREDAHKQFMRDPWMFFRRRPVSLSRER
jgi:hypothetical protein